MVQIIKHFDIPVMDSSEHWIATQIMHQVSGPPAVKTQNRKSEMCEVTEISATFT